MNAPSPAPTASTGRAALAIALVAALACAAASVWLARQVDALATRVGDAERALGAVHRTTELIRLEGRSAGRGIGAIIEQIEYWAPQLGSASTPAPTAATIEAALRGCLDAVEALGERAWPELLAALESPDPRDDETRKWLIEAALRASPERGPGLLTGVVRGTRLAPSPRLRFLAADLLLEHDKALAGEVLSQVLQFESARGIDRDRLPPELAPEFERAMGTNSFPEFFNLIDRFVRSGHEDVEAVLRMMIGRAEHDRMTYQVCVRELGKLHSRAAVPRIKELYARPPGNELNPLFLNVCLQAIADIEGPAACDWFREQQRGATIPIVQTKLQDLIKQLCS